jgi:hypothetical protein
MPCPSHPPWLDHSNYTWRRVQVLSREHSNILVTGSKPPSSPNIWKNISWTACHTTAIGLYCIESYRLIGRDLEGRGHSLIEVIFLRLPAETEENHGRPQNSRYRGPESKPDTFRM